MARINWTTHTLDGRVFLTIEGVETRLTSAQAKVLGHNLLRHARIAGDYQPFQRDR